MDRKLEEKILIRKEIKPIIEDLVSEIRELKEAIMMAQMPKKKFRLPGRTRLSRNNLKRNYAIVQLLKRNKEIDFLKLQIEDGMVNIPINGTFHAVKADDVMGYQKQPFIIVPEWDLTAYNPYNTIKDNNITTAQKVIINAVKRAQMKEKKPLPGKTLLIGLVVVIVLGLIASKMGLF